MFALFKNGVLKLNERSNGQMFVIRVDIHLTKSSLYDCVRFNHKQFSKLFVIYFFFWGESFIIDVIKTKREKEYKNNVIAYAITIMYK